MRLAVVVFVVLAASVDDVAGALTSVNNGDCVCATITVNARSEGSLRGTVLFQYQLNQCATYQGSTVNNDGYQWYKLKSVATGQVAWAAGNFFNKGSASSCQAPSVSSSSCPPIISRSEWGARPPKSVSYQSHPAQYAFIHHSVTSDCFSRSACQSSVKAIQNYHMDTHGWPDIGYTFIIGGDGSIFEGKGWDKIGTHTGGYNHVGFGFCFLGNFMTHAPSDIQISRAQQLIGCGVALGKLSPSYTLKGHRDMGATACPGDVLYSMIKNWPHYQ